MTFDKFLKIFGNVIGWIGVFAWLMCYAALAITGHPMPEGVDQLAILSLIILKFSE